MLSRIKLLFSTVKYLKFLQVKYQIIYRIIKPGSLNHYPKNYDPKTITFLSFLIDPTPHTSFIEPGTFNFLNKQVTFGTTVDWNFQKNGKLWNYNLQYCNYLMQQDVSLNVKKRLLTSLYSWLDDGKLPLEPYPVSLRAINVVRLLSKYQIDDQVILQHLYSEFAFLSRRFEFHLLGNHLLENAFSLFMGGFFFNNQEWIYQGKGILEKELDEQILQDGGHFELSPMYHQIIFFRLLELVDWYNKVNDKDLGFETFLRDKAVKMLAWLTAITFENGDIPHFNDSTNGIAYSTAWLTEYARDLNIAESPDSFCLKHSGYRSFKNEVYECKVDVGEIGPSYQPGHGHADALSFVLHYAGQPLFVEAGTSTYENNEIRQMERSTQSHNTVELNNKNQSDVYGGFRVGKRAETKVLSDEKHRLIAQHDGYLKSLGSFHKRSFYFEDNNIVIIDEINSALISRAYFHCHPDFEIQLKDNSCYIGDFCTISFRNMLRLEKKNYRFVKGFSCTANASLIVVEFVKKLESHISFV